jgi:hypothetical protein
MEISLRRNQEGRTSGRDLLITDKLPGRASRDNNSFCKKKAGPWRGPANGGEGEKSLSLNFDFLIMLNSLPLSIL